MDLSFTPEELAFRAEVQRFLREEDIGAEKQDADGADARIVELFREEEPDQARDPQHGERRGDLPHDQHGTGQLFDAALEKAVAEYTARYAIREIPRPPHWSGFRIRPTSIEFWKDQKFRLHDRVEFRRPSPEGEWDKVRMYP